MSHAEIWDDSSLVESWNEAVEEYKRYHSIHVRGENVDVLHSDENVSNSFAVTDGNQCSAQERSVGDREAEYSLKNDNSLYENETGKLEKKPMGVEHRTKLPSANQSSKLGHSESPSNVGPTLPQHLIGSVHDEGLKSLLMSWYYAGYYTGLYEGQHKTS